MIDKTKLYGVLNDLDGTPIRRRVRILKLSIGLPKGPDVHIWIDAQKKWKLAEGDYAAGAKRKMKTREFENEVDARKAYIEARKVAPVRGYPIKIPYFTFLRMGSDGDYIHDLDAIAEHGPLPTEVDIVFLIDEPFEAQYRYFTAAELKCEGDGRNARRRITWPQSDEDRKLALIAESKGEKWFPIIEGCAARGCPFAQSEGDKGPACKPHGRLYLQLVNSPKIGGTCSFDTTGKRSISQVVSCIEEIKDATKGQLRGIPLTLVVRPYKTSHNGKPTVQYGISLEARGRSALDLWRTILEQAKEFHAIAESIEPRQLGPAPTDPVATAPGTGTAPDEAGEPVVDPSDAAALEAEFYTEGGDDDDDAGFGDSEGPAATETPAEAAPAKPRNLDQLTERLAGQPIKEGNQQGNTNPAPTTPKPDTPPPAQGLPLATNALEALAERLRGCTYVVQVKQIEEELLASAPEAHHEGIKTMCDERVRIIKDNLAHAQQHPEG